ncbi:MAG: hypothetical protein M1831_004110 [Alyxoria varia]|nr:MAG: hypothetical protein M1831_004110 [Alyxoria varia]
MVYERAENEDRRSEFEAQEQPSLDDRGGKRRRHYDDESVATARSSHIPKGDSINSIYPSHYVLSTPDSRRRVESYHTPRPALLAPETLSHFKKPRVPAKSRQRTWSAYSTASTHKAPRPARPSDTREHSRSLMDNPHFRGPVAGAELRRVDHNPASFHPGQIIRFRWVQPSMDPNSRRDDDFLARDVTGWQEDMSAKIRYFVIVETHEEYMVCNAMYSHNGRGKTARQIMFKGLLPDYSTFSVIKCGDPNSPKESTLHQTPTSRTLYINPSTAYEPAANGTTLHCEPVSIRYNMPIEKVNGMLTWNSLKRLQQWIVDKSEVGMSNAEYETKLLRLGDLEMDWYRDVFEWRRA